MRSENKFLRVLRFAVRLLDVGIESNLRTVFLAAVLVAALLVLLEILLYFQTLASARRELPLFELVRQRLDHLHHICRLLLELRHFYLELVLGLDYLLDISIWVSRAVGVEVKWERRGGEVLGVGFGTKGRVKHCV
jgi:hypothetical protein